MRSNAKSVGHICQFTTISLYMCFNVSPSILIKNFIKLLKYLKIIKEILL